jgi:uncharacterized repeat protein (TIGR01451 family)
MSPLSTARTRCAVLIALLASLPIAGPALATGTQPAPCVAVVPQATMGDLSPLWYPTPPPQPQPPKRCDLAIAKTAPATAPPGSTIVFSVRVGNVGEIPAARADIHVTDPSLTPGELAFYAVVSGDADQLLEPGEVWEYRLPGGGLLSRPADVCGTVTNTASLAPLTAETSTGDNTSSTSTTVAGPQCAPPGPGPAPPAVAGATVPSGPTRIVVTKLSRRASVGRRAIPFRIIVRNAGTAVATNVWVSDRLPAGTSALRRPKGATLRGGFIRWNVGDIPPGGTVRVGLWLRPDTNKARNICNTARAVGGNAPRVLDRTCVRVVRVAGVRTPPPRVTG